MNYILKMATILKYSKVDPKKIGVSDLVEAKYTNNFYLDFNGEKFTVQSNSILNDYWGIPREDDYHTDEDSRMYMTIGLDGLKDLEKTRESKDDNTKRCSENNDFKNKLLEIDDIMQSDEVKTKLFGKNKDKYIYSPIIKPCNEDIEDDRYNPEKIKLKFYWKKPEDGTGPSFKIFERKQTGESTYERTEVDTSTIENVDDLTKKYMGYMRKMKFIFSMNGWSNKKPKGKGQPMSYGISLRIVKVEVEEKKRPTTSTNTTSFVDDSDEETVDVIAEKSTKSEDANDSDEDSDNDDDDDENDDDESKNNELDNELETIKPKRRTRTKK